MASLNQDGGVNIDLELKSFFAVASYAILKFVGLNISQGLAVTLARAFFVIGHAVIVLNFLKSRNAIAQLTLSHETKGSAQAGVKKVFWNLMGRAVIITLIHLRTGMLPPLLISVFMGTFSMMENPHLLDGLMNSYPKIFGKFNEV